MTTCKDCMYNTLQIVPNSREMSHACTRFPPISHAIATQQGIAMMCAYPVITDAFPACGEWDDGQDIVIEHANKLAN